VDATLLYLSIVDAKRTIVGAKHTIVGTERMPILTGLQWRLQMQAPNGPEIKLVVVPERSS
jgi:hypothetical protein